MQYAFLSFSRCSLFYGPCISSLCRLLSFSSPSSRSSFFLSRTRRSRFSSARQGIPRGIFFQRGSTREHAAPSWGACINIRLIMLDATITGPRGPQVRPGAFPARATVKFPCPDMMFNLHIAVAYVTELVSRQMQRIAVRMKRIRQTVMGLRENRIKLQKKKKSTISLRKTRPETTLLPRISEKLMKLLLQLLNFQHYVSRRLKLQFRRVKSRLKFF